LSEDFGASPMKGTSFLFNDTHAMASTIDELHAFFLFDFLLTLNFSNTVEKSSKCFGIHHIFLTSLDSRMSVRINRTRFQSA
jgi:hypothetical protein